MGGGPDRSRAPSTAPRPASPQARGGAPVAWFADAARRLGAATRAAGLVVPAFRCPPRTPGVPRTVRRYPGGAVVSVVLAGRRPEEVAIDMVEGVIVVNRLEGDAALRFRTTLLEAARSAPASTVPGPPAPEPRTESPGPPAAEGGDPHSRAA